MRGSWAWGVGALLLGCSSSSVEKGAPAPSPDGGSPAPTTPHTLSVLVATVDTPLGTPAPRPGAFVGIDLPTGEHLDLVADAGGRVALDGIDWSAGAVTLVGYGVPRHTVGVVTDLDLASLPKLLKPKALADKADVVLVLGPLEGTDGPVTMTGLVSGSAVASAPALVSGTACTNVSERPGSYTLGCAPGKPFTLLVRDEQITPGPNNGFSVAKNRWFQVEVPAQTGQATRLDVDVTTATHATVKTANMHLAVSDAVKAAFGTLLGLVQVTSAEGQLAPYLGALASRTTVPSGVDVEVEWTEPPGATLYTSAVLVDPKEGTSSRLVRRGVPAEGATFDGWIVPMKPAAVSLKAPLPIVGAPPTAWIRVVVATPTSTITFDAPPGTTTMHPPATLPPEARPTDASVASGRVVFLDQPDDAIGAFLAAGASPPVPAKLP